VLGEGVHATLDDLARAKGVAPSYVSLRGHVSQELDPLWDEPVPVEQARIVQLLVERVEVRVHGVDVRLRPNGLTGRVRDVIGNRRAAA
jgi:hypothetical protein